MAKKVNKGGASDEDEAIYLVEGSEYEVTSLGSKDKPTVTRGVFKGFTMVGTHAEAICIEMDGSHKKLKGKMRVIPTHMILTIDIIKKAKEEREQEEDSSSRSYI